MRGGLRGFYIFIACIALGTGTIAAVNSLANGLGNGITAEGQSLLGGDAAFSFIHRQASEEERAWLAAQGRLSEVATLRAMARPDSGRQTLVELKGVDEAYPLYGSVRLASGRPLDAVLAEDPEGAVPAVVDTSLLTTAGLERGDRFGLGRLTVEIVDVIEREPDKLSGGVGFGPRVMIPVGALEESGLVTTGSLVRWRYRVAGENGPLSDAALESLVERARAAFPQAGWRVETRTEAAPGLQESIARFAQFLTLVGLTSLAVGGVGVANAVRAYLARKTQTIATLRSLGATPRFVVWLYLAQIMMLAGIGIAAGLVLGAVAPPIAGAFLAGLLPVSSLFSLFPGALALAALYGALTALTFALFPLGRAYGIRPIALFRDDEDERVTTGRRAFLAATAAAALALAALAVAAAYDRLLALGYIVGALLLFVLLRAVATGVMALARRVPRSRSTVVRMAIVNLFRRGSLTPTVTLSLGLSLTLLVTLALVDGNLRNTLLSRLPDQAPSFFFIDIQDREKGAFLAELEEVAPQGEINTQPMLRGRIVAINDTPAEEWPETEASWVLRGDRGITYAAEPPPNSEILAGDWWSGDGSATREMSFAAELARELGVGVGDTVKVNVLGREIEATISNLRSVEWESLSINFVMMFSPDVFAGAPHAHLATLTYPGGGTEAQELRVLSRMAEAFPTVTTVRVKEALEAVNGVVADLVLAVRAAAAVTLIAAVLVLAGTLAASHRSRIYDAVILKTLGARRRTILSAYALEYVLLGATAAAFGIVAGGIAGWLIVDELMEIDFVFLPTAAVTAVAAAVVVTVGLGLVGTWRALGEKPAPVLRNL
jgi:putative ABC transport system permease protein